MIIPKEIGFQISLREVSWEGRVGGKGREEEGDGVCGSIRYLFWVHLLEDIFVLLSLLLLLLLFSFVFSSFKLQPC